MNPILIAILAAAVIMNLVAFFLLRYDKQCAIKGKWRVPEATLFLVTALFGGIGGTAGMLVFRHKTQHWYFKLFFPLMMVIQIGIIIYAVIKLG